MLITNIISGGQTGVDRAALDVALELGVPCGGWCPSGGRAEDGKLDPKYLLKETPSEDYTQRTEWNVRDSDGTLILAFGAPSGGTAYTIECAKRYRKPFLVIDMKNESSPELFSEWVHQHHIKKLNVAGPRESASPGVIYKRAKAILLNWL